MIMKGIKIFCLSFLLLSSFAAFALKVGDIAPELEVSSWLKNGKTTLASGKGKNIYVIEFWATTCKPCKKVMPYLHKLQNQYKDLIIVSISPEKASIVKSFIAKYPNINYKIAVDEQRKTHNSYMGKNLQIPLAVIVQKNGTIAWIGHPLDMYLPLQRIITGKFNVKKSQRRQKMYGKIQTLLSQKKFNEALKIVEAERKKATNNIQLIALKSYILFHLNKKTQALEFATSMLQKHPSNMEIFDLKCYILNQMKKYKELDAFYLTFINNCKDKPVLLNQLARKLLGTKFGEAKLTPALRAIELAYSNHKLYKNQRANIGETLARIYYMIGRIDRAVNIQKVVCRIYKKNKSPKYIYNLRILEYYQKAYSLGQGKN